MKKYKISDFIKFIISNLQKKSDIFHKNYKNLIEEYILSIKEFSDDIDFAIFVSTLLENH
jgi:hypothetical protein